VQYAGASREVVQGLDVDEVVEYIGRLESNTFARCSEEELENVILGEGLQMAG
jgi:hypothetical protein